MSQPIQSWIDGHLAARHHAYETHGFVELDAGPRWPRTSGADVIAIAALLDGAVRCYATHGIARRWRATLADIERVAITSPRDVYPNNVTFWSTFEAIAVYLDDLEVEPPSSEIWNALLDLMGTHRNLGPSGDGPIAHFDHIKTYDDLYNAQLKLLKVKRGTDTLDQPAGFTGGMRDIPRTTNADALQLATYWATELAKVKHVFGHDGIVARWTPVMADVDKLAKPGVPDAVYAKNNDLWRGLQEVAIQIAVSDEAPSKWDMIFDSVKDSVMHLPETLSGAASKGAELVEGAAHAVGRVANEAGKGLFSRLGAPVLIGAGLLGLFLITRSRNHDKEV